MLADLIQAHIHRRGYSYGQISTLSQNFSPTGVTLLPKSTVQGWVNESKPTLPLERLLVLSRVLDLTANETNELLRASQYHEISRLLQTTEQNTIRVLLSHWDYRGLIFQAPREPIWFIGREVDKKRIKQILRHAPGRLCFLYGEGGVGKSALAIRIAHEMRSEFPDGVLWAEVNGETSLLPILRSFAACFGYHLEPFVTVEQCKEQVRSLLQAKRCLVVLDNIASAHELESVLPAEGSCATLVTLRDGALAKHFFRGVAHHLPRFVLGESIELLVEILGQMRVQKELKAAQQLSLFADGLPLVLRLIGSALRSADSLSLSGYVNLLTTKLAELGDWERLTDRERIVRATFEVSYQRLLPDVRPFFASLGLFTAHHFSVQAVSRINQLDQDETRLLLAQLVDLSLIQAYTVADLMLSNFSDERYQLHTLLQLFAFEKLMQEAPALYDVGEAYFQDLVNQNIAEMIDQEWLNIAGFIQSANTKKALKTLETFVAPLTQIETSSIGYMDARGHYLLAFECLSTLLNQAEEMSRAICHYKCGVFAMRLNQREEAKAHLKASESILTSQSLTEVIALHLAAVYEHLARLDEQQDMENAMSQIEAGLRILNTFSGRDVELQKSALIVVHSAILYRANAARDLVITIAQQGLDSLPQYDNVAHLNALTNLAIAHAQKGDMDKAGVLFRNGAEYAKQAGNKRKLADFYINLGIISRRNLHLKQAVSYQTQAKELFEELGIVSKVGSTLNNLAKIYYMYEDDETAASHAKKAIQITKENNLQELETVAKATLAQIQIRQKQYEEALVLLETCHDLVRGQAAPAYLLPYILLFKGEIAYRKQNLADASSLFKATIEIGEKLEILTVGLAKLSYAKLLSDENNVEEATTLYEEAMSILATQDRYELAIAQQQYAQHLLKNDYPAQDKISFLLEDSGRIFAQIHEQK